MGTYKKKEKIILNREISKKKLIWFILVSVGLHFGFILFLLVLQDKILSSSDLESKKGSKIIEDKIVEITVMSPESEKIKSLNRNLNPKSDLQASQSALLREKNQLSPKKYAIKNLGIPFSYSQKHIKPSFHKNEEDDGEKEEKDDDVDAFISGSRQSRKRKKFFVLEKDYSIYQQIYQLIENQLTFPSEFIEASLTGTVAAKIYFNPLGEYIRSKSVFESAHPYLKIHIIRVLRKLFSVEVLNFKVSNPKEIVVHCFFQFSFHSLRDETPDSVQKKNLLLGNKLFFYRSIYKSKLAWDLGPLHGSGPAVGIDPFWFGRLFSKKAKIDPLEKYRNDPEW